jgi:hypothetical protein
MLLSSDDPEVSPLFHALDPKLLPSLLINPVGLTLLISAAPLAQRARSQGHRDPMLCTHEHMLLDIAELNGFKGHDLRHIGNQKLRAMCAQIHFADFISNGWCVMRTSLPTFGYIPAPKVPGFPAHWIHRHLQAVG